ncbi:MAG: glycoside hydrolase family 99-like domain-containing protein [Lachnospiraceae bacterium]|nr:glycoside hydrolase family 99-like domain-containing protein [Lachnospiraceae bacterium]
MDRKLPKVIAIYLPQFHETKDNNMWWGKGFTDWDTIRSADTCFEGHNAPWVPYENNYYDLSKYETMKWQAEVAKKYGIDGFSFYHYYFANGKMELELPAENLLKWKDIDMPFCFNWASESWIRSWSKISGNVWSEKYEKEDEDYSNGVLVRQEYGGVNEWIKHFEYLLPFFKDPRYICIDNKPVFIFYNPNDIICLDEMAILWKRLAKESGLNGLYLIGVDINVVGTNLDASIVHEPRRAINSLNDIGKTVNQNGVRCYESKDVWNKIVDSLPYNGCKTYYTGVAGYDDTPRRGKRGKCITGNIPELFGNGIERLLERSIQEGNELLFINAWNEWGEGMYLEPDERDKFTFLEAFKKAKIRTFEKSDKIKKEDKRDYADARTEILEMKKENAKYKYFTYILNIWLETERNGKFNFCEYFALNGIESVAIYGMSMLGKQLYQQLKKEGVLVAYGIDRIIGKYGEEFTIIRPEEEYPEVDAIIVTTYDNTSIIETLKGKCAAKILTLDKLIERFWEN